MTSTSGTKPTICGIVTVNWPPKFSKVPGAVSSGDGDKTVVTEYTGEGTPCSHSRKCVLVDTTAAVLGHPTMYEIK
jgi:hypothetical protein